MDLKDRQITAVSALLVLVFLVPAVVAAGLGIATGWAYVLGTHDVHGTIWGWLSTRHVRSHGETVWGGSAIIWEYFLGIVTAYLAYQVFEFLRGCFVLFREALT